MTYYKLVEYFVKQKGEAHRKLIVEEQEFIDDFNKSWCANSKKASSHQICRFDIQSTKFLVKEAFNLITQEGEIKYTLNLWEE